MQGALVELSRWTRENGLCRKQKTKTPRFLPPMSDGLTLSLSSEAKYFGTILDQQLNWRLKIEEHPKRGLIAFYSCKNSIGKSWRLKPLLSYAYTNQLSVRFSRKEFSFGSVAWENILQDKQ